MCQSYVRYVLPGAPAFIATQGPLSSTTCDFWRMVFQTRAGLIAMVTNIVEGRRAKCHQYWPEAGAPVSFGGADGTALEVALVAETVGLSWARRTLRITHKRDVDVLARHEVAAAAAA